MLPGWPRRRRWRTLLPPAVGLTLSLLASIAHGFALGEPQVRSALNRPLDIRIPVTAGDDESLAKVEIGLAPSAIFQRLDLPYAAVLHDLKIDMRREGGAFVHLTTTEPVTEPVLDFVIEANASGGRLFRTYTVLLDPPGRNRGHSDASPDEAPAAAESKPARSGTMVDERPSAAVKPRAAPPSRPKSTTYRVRSNEILARIADRLREGTSATREQMMLALFRQNPDAFYRDNVNAVKAGAKLRVPPEETVLAIPAEAAANEVERQYRTWRERRSAPKAVARQAEQSPPREADDKAPDGAAATAAADVPDEDSNAPGRAPEPPAGGRLALVTPPREADTAGGAQVPAGTEGQLRERLERVVELNAGLRAENEELWRQLERVEKQVAMLTRRVMERPRKGAAEPKREPVPLRVAARAVDGPANLGRPWWSNRLLWWAAAAGLSLGLLAFVGYRVRARGSGRLRYRWIRKQWG